MPSQDHFAVVLESKWVQTVMIWTSMLRHFFKISKHRFLRPLTHFSQVEVSKFGAFLVMFSMFFPRRLLKGSQARILAILGSLRSPLECHWEAIFPLRWRSEIRCWSRGSRQGGELLRATCRTPLRHLFEEQIQRRGRRQRQKCTNAWEDSPSFQAFSPGCSNMLILIRGLINKQ